MSREHLDAVVRHPEMTLLEVIVAAATTTTTTTAATSDASQATVAVPSWEQQEGYYDGGGGRPLSQRLGDHLGEGFHSHRNDGSGNVGGDVYLGRGGHSSQEGAGEQQGLWLHNVGGDDWAKNSARVCQSLPTQQLKNNAAIFPLTHRL